MPGLYRRMEAIACRFWGCAPPQLEDWQAQGRITMMQVIELIHMLMHDPIVAIWVMDYLYPEDKALREKEEADAKRQRQIDQWHITALRMLNKCTPKDDTEATQIAAMKETLAHGN